MNISSKKKKYVPNLITGFGLACGLFVIFRSTSLSSINNADLLLSSALILLLAAVADLFDGAVARKLKVESEFGFTFDTLADVVSFGVAPAVLLLRVNAVQSVVLHFILIVTAIVYALCGVLRLVRFNVMHMQETKNPFADLVEKKWFIGLPVPAGAALSISTNLFLSANKEFISFGVSFAILVLIHLIIAIAMVSKLRYPTLKTLSWELFFPRRIVLFIVVLILLLVLGVLWFTEVFMALSMLYLISGLIIAAWRIAHIIKKKHKG